MKIHILANNTVRKRGFLAEHGLSILIEYHNCRILFDTGQSDVFCKNAERMGLDLKAADAIVLSHGHYDHGGGLCYFPSAEFPPIYVHPAAFRKRFAEKPERKNFREIGFSWDLDGCGKIRDRIRFVRGCTRIFPGVTLCSEISDTVDFEGKPNGFYYEEGGVRHKDLFLDEQVLVFEGDDSLSVFLGCSHPGVANCLSYVSVLFPGRRIGLIAGGMHLGGAGSQRVQDTIRFFKDRKIEKIIPLHCTGLTAVAEMKRQLGDRCLLLNSGDSWEC